MQHVTSSSRKSLTPTPLRLNAERPELSTGLSSYRCTLEKTMRPMFNNPDLSNASFLNQLYNLIQGLLRYESQMLPIGSNTTLLEIMEKYQNGQTTKSTK